MPIVHHLQTMIPLASQIIEKVQMEVEQMIQSRAKIRIAAAQAVIAGATERKETVMEKYLKESKQPTK